MALTEIRDALAEIVTVADATRIIDRAEALRVCCKKAGLSLEVVNLAAESKLRAEREAGRMLAETVSHTGGRPKNGSIVEPFSLDTIGVSKKQSHRWQRISSLADDLFEAELDDFRDSQKEITTSHFLKLAAQERTTPPSMYDELPPVGGDIVADLQELIEQGRKFSTIYADPPWRYSNQATRAATDNHYKTMTVDEICEEPVSQLVADNAHLHLWTTNAFLFESKRVIEAWGFEYKSCFVWCKPQMGIGNYWRVSHEFLLFGVRGDCPFRNRGLQSWEAMDRTKHSQKPWQVRQKVERASPGPYLELYGREALPNSDWTVYGNQIGKRMF